MPSQLSGSKPFTPEYIDGNGVHSATSRHVRARIIEANSVKGPHRPGKAQ